jgi:hypothetical protein
MPHSPPTLSPELQSAKKRGEKYGMHTLWEKKGQGGDSEQFLYHVFQTAQEGVMGTQEKIAFRIGVINGAIRNFVDESLHTPEPKLIAAQRQAVENLEGQLRHVQSNRSTESLDIQHSTAQEVGDPSRDPKENLPIPSRVVLPPPKDPSYYRMRMKGMQGEIIRRTFEAIAQRHATATTA